MLSEAGSKRRASVDLIWLRGRVASRMRVPRGPLRKGTSRHPSKKTQCEKKSLVKLKRRGTNTRSITKAVSQAKLRGLELMPESKDARISKAVEETLEDHDLCMEPLAAEANGYSIFQPCIPNEEEEEDDDDDNKEEGAEESYKAGLSTVSQIGPEMQRQAFELDNSIFLNEDSNQPLPMDRFFGSVAFTQDLPTAPLSRANISRREFRKTHFIANDDDDDDDEEVV